MAINSEIVSCVDSTQYKASTIRKRSRCEWELMEHSPYTASLDNNIIWILLILWKER